ncbi:MAG: histidine--tRNA ligase, partial [Acidobacteriota bacterium]|nr:histidine--tRNA ligase [Acidobacteriota bacterium]
NIIKSVYESYGFQPLETPAVENIETLTGKYGEEGNQLIYKILKRGEGAATGEADLALRYDLTVPLARVVANHKNDLPKFFKRYQIQPVWRADRPARGRYREFYQCDADAIGSNSMIVEAELISAVCEILDKLRFKDYLVKFNHRNLLFSILESAKVPNEKHNDALVVIDKLDKLSVEQVSNELIQKGISENSTKQIMDLYQNVATVWNRGVDVNEVLLSITLGGDIDIREDLIKTINLVKNPRLLIYPFLARGLSYYTGSIFEIVLTNGDFQGSIGGGGRYDGLIGMFGKEQIPACGFSLGLERILVVMEERGMFPPELQNNSADVMVTIWNEGAIGESLKLANDLRAEGLRVLVYPEADKLGKQFKYASTINVPFVCVLGESELAENKVTLKNMQTGEQETVAREKIAAKVA